MNKEYRRLIKKHLMTMGVRSGKEGIIIGNNEITDEELLFVKAKRIELMSEIKAINLEKAAEEKVKREATVNFYSSGWESHQIHIDTRYDIDTQLEKEANYYPDDCTFESLKNDFEKAFNKRKEEKEAVEKRAAKRKEEIAKIKEKAIASGEKQTLDSWQTGCDDPDEECNLDFVTKWAMPDGTEKITRQHTW